MMKTVNKYMLLSLIAVSGSGIDASVAPAAAPAPAVAPAAALPQGPSLGSEGYNGLKYVATLGVGAIIPMIVQYGWNKWTGEAACAETKERLEFDGKEIANLQATINLIDGNIAAISNALKICEQLQGLNDAD